MTKSILFLIVSYALLFNWSATSQTTPYRIEFEHFEESRGSGNQEVITELPYSEIVLLHNPLGSKSGLGSTFNFNGNVVVVDQFNTLDNGTIQVILRREDGKNFFGYTRTLKAILKPIDSIGE